MDFSSVHVVIDEPDMYDYRELLAQHAPGMKVTLCETPAAPPADIADSEILLTWRPHENVLKGMPRLKWIQSTGAGVEAILRSPHYSPSIPLSRAGGMAAPQMAEYVAAFILATTFRIPFVAINQTKQQWKPFKVPLVRDRRCTILGMGEIGQETALLCQAMGMQVKGITRSGGEPLNGIPNLAIADLDRVLPETDILVIVVPLTAETEGMIDANRLNLLPPGALLINMSRGPVIVESDLVEALQTLPMQAVLDVFNEEPLPANSPLWSMENVIVTPHIAGPYDPVYCTKIFLENVERYLSGQPLNFLVDYSRGY